MSLAVSSLRLVEIGAVVWLMGFCLAIIAILWALR